MIENTENQVYQISYSLNYVRHGPDRDPVQPVQAKPNPKKSFEMFVGIESSLMRASHSSLRCAVRLASVT